jgi:hypothetical protein
MNSLQEDRVSMLLAVRSLLNRDEIRPIWSGTDYFAGFVGRLGVLITEILEVSLVQELNRTGVAIMKKERREALTGAAMKVVNGVRAYAALTEDEELLAALGYSLRDLKKARDTHLLGIAGRIFEVADPLRVQLARVRLTTEDVERVNVLRGEFLEMIAAPRLGAVEKKGATDLLRVKLREAGLVLRNKMDLMVSVFENEHVDFVLEYFSTRRLVRTGVRHTGAWLRGQVVDKVSGAGVGGARVRIEEKKRTKVKVTNGEGLFGFLFKTKCEVTVVVEAEGYGICRKAVKMTGRKGVTVRCMMESVEMR